MRNYPNKEFPEGSVEKHILRGAEDRIMKKKESAFTTGDLADGERGIARISGVTYIYVRFGDTISRVTTTDQ